MEQLNKQKSFLSSFEDQRSDEIKDQFKGELATLKVRLEGLALCLESSDEVPVKQFIARFGFPDSPACPCEDYDRLQPISVFWNILEEYNKCQTPDQPCAEGDKNKPGKLAEVGPSKPLFPALKSGFALPRF